MSTAFTKYHGLGNDFILIDNRDSREPKISPEAAVKWCNRNFGIGGDGVIFALPGQPEQSGQPATDYTMRIYNSDGSEPEMCGNGIRCMARFIADLEGVDPAAGEKQYRIHTLAGLIVPTLKDDGTIRVDMGEPVLQASEIPTTLAGNDGRSVDQALEVEGKIWQVTNVSMGNPHCITFVEDADAIDLATIGVKFEHHPAFPQRTNTEFIQVISRGYLKMKVWERGAGATLACGTGACASLVAAVLNDKSDRQATLELPGGNLTIEWNEADNHIYMTGPAQRVFSGQWEATGKAGSTSDASATNASASASANDIDCAVACVNGCVLGDECPNKEEQAKANQFINDTPLSEMLEMAAAAVERKRNEREAAAKAGEREAPKWVIPEGGIDPSQL